MTIEAITDFKDMNGRLRKKGERWSPCCDECARKLIKAGKVKKV